jgi:hypothetical protein
MKELTEDEHESIPCEYGHASDGWTRSGRHANWTCPGAATRSE